MFTASVLSKSRCWFEPKAAQRDTHTHTHTAMD